MILFSIIVSDIAVSEADFFYKNHRGDTLKYSIFSTFPINSYFILIPI